MSVSYYSIQIFCEKKGHSLISNILGVTPKDHIPSNLWEYQVTSREEDEYFDFINEFMNLLEDKFIKLKELGIERTSISIWLVYEYDEQCNMEFDPNDLKRLGDNGVGLCISCY